MKRLYTAIISLIVLLFVFLGTNFGLSCLLKTTSKFISIEYTQPQGSLFSGHIHISKLLYSPSQKTEIILHDITLEGIHIFKGSIDKASIKSIHMPIQILNTLKFNNQSHSSFKINHISIKQLNITTHPMTKPLKFTKIEISNSDSTMSFYFQQKPYQLSLDNQNFDKAYVLKLMADKFIISLIGYADDEGFYFDSADNSDLKNFHIRYSKEEGTLGMYVDHQAEDQTLKGNAKIAPDDTIINIDRFVWKSPHQDIDIKGLFDSKKNHYHFDANYNNSRIRATLLDDGNLIASGYIEEVAFITPYAEGSCNFNLELTTNDSSFYAHAHSITLPISKLSDVQITYNTQNSRYLNISASQLRNPLVLLTNPSITLQKSNGNDKVTAIALYENQLQQVTASITRQDPITIINLDKFLLQNAIGERWKIKTSPITIQKNMITLPQTTINYKDQYITLDGYYNTESYEWALNHIFNNAHINFNSQGIIDADTEINITDAILNGKAVLHSNPKQSLKLSGYYDLSNISASLMNIVPKFIFPLDMELQNSHIYWKDGKLNAELYSPQGNVIIKSGSEGHHISSPNLTFNHYKNMISSSIDLHYSDHNTLAGYLKLKEAHLELNPDEAFESFPKDIDIIGKVSTAKPNSSNMDVNLELSSPNIPVYLFGFNGNANGELNIKIEGNKPMLVTGDISLEDPKLNLLNRSIKMETLELNYHQQSWLKGNINLALEKSVMVNSASTKVANTDIKLTAYGPVDSPSFTVTSVPVPVSQFEAFTYIFSTSKQLPQGNENFALLEAISGLKRNQGIVAFLQALNQVSKLFVFDITFRPEYNQKQTFSDDFIKSDLTISKQLYEKVWISIRQQLNEERSNFAMTYRINPWLSTELQYNRTDSTLAGSLFYRN